MPAVEPGAQLFGLVRLLTIAVCWSRFAGGATAAFADGPLGITLSVAFWIFSGLAFVGVFARWTTLLTGLVCFGFYYGVGLYGNVQALTSHHVFAQALLTCLIALTPCDRALCLRPSEGPVELWSQHLLRLQISVLYLGGVYEKSYQAWLDGTRFEQLLHYIYLGSDAVELGAWGGVFSVLAIGVWAAELFIALAVWFPRLIVPVLVVGAVLHGGIYAATPVATFSTTMFVFLLAIVPVDRFAEAVQAPVLHGRSRAWWAAPLVVAPIFGVLGWGPDVRALDGLALQACDVQISRHGRVIPVSSKVLGEGEDGVRRAAGRLCRRWGPVDVDGRCASAEGWEAIDWHQICPELPRAPTGRQSAW